MAAFRTNAGMIYFGIQPFCDKLKPCEVCGHTHIDIEVQQGMYIVAFCWNCGAATDTSRQKTRFWSDDVRAVTDDWNNDRVYAWDEENGKYHDNTIKESEKSL